MKRALIMMALGIILVLALGVAGCSSGPDQTPVPQPGSPAPDFQLKSLDGQTISLSGLRGRPVMLNFWATWCGPCRVEMPFIQEVFEDEEWKEQGLVILSVNLGESPAKAANFMEEGGLSFTVLLDSGRDVAKLYNISHIPVTYFIDKNGIIVDKKIGSFSSKADIDWRLINSIIDGE